MRHLPAHIQGMPSPLATARWAPGAPSPSSRPSSGVQIPPSGPPARGHPVLCHGGCVVEAVGAVGAVGAAGGRRGAAVGSKVTVAAGGGERGPERDGVLMGVSWLGVPLLSHAEAPVGRRAGPRQAGRMQDRPGLIIALGWEEEEGWGFLCDASSSSYPALPGSTCDTGTLRVPPAPPAVPHPHSQCDSPCCRLHSTVSPGAPTVPAARTSATPTIPCRCHPPLLSGPITAVTPRRRRVSLHFTF